MKNINDLGENECIYCPTRKSALKILNVFGDTSLIHKWTDYTKFFYPYTKEFLDAIDSIQFTEFGYKQFLPKKKASIKKRLNKVEAEILRLNDLYDNDKYVVHKFKGSKEYSGMSTEKLRELTERKTELELNRWYKVNLKEESKYFGIVNLINIQKEKIDFYGICQGTWREDWLHPDPCELIIATPKEIEQALSQEAKKRGIIYNCYIEDIDNGIKTLVPFQTYNFEGNDYSKLYFGTVKIFDNGKWATVITESERVENEIDWSEKGQMVEDNDTLVFTDGYQDAMCFGGQVMQKNKHYKEGHYRKDWHKGSFKLSDSVLIIGKRIKT